jgi:hypothetical protein
VGLAQSTAFEHQQRRFDFALAFLQTFVDTPKTFFHQPQYVYRQKANSDVHCEDK